MKQATLTAPMVRLSLVREQDVDYTLCKGHEGDGLTHPETAARLIEELLRGEPAEVLGALLLNARNALLGVIMPYRGTINSAPAEPRGFIVPALLANASSLLLFHNHPSGDPSPSAEDVAATKKIAAAGETTGVRVIDHIIVGSGSPGGTGCNWFSLRSNGGW